MTPLEGGLLLLGIFGVPLVLLSLGQRFRHRGRRARGAFWGGIVGYAVGLIIWSTSLFLPPVLWDAGTVRIAGVILPLLGIGAVGVAIGALIGREPRRRPKAGSRKAGKTASAGAIAVALTSAGALAAQPPEEIFVLQVLDAEVLLAETAPDVPPYAYASSVAVLGADGVLLVDTFHGPAAAEWFLDRIAERTDVPVRWVVNTHHHGDHLWGNAAVLERFPDAEIMAHPNTVARVRDQGAEALDEERARLDGRIARIEAQLSQLSSNDPRRDQGTSMLARSQAQRREVDRIVLSPPTSPVSDFRRIDVGNRTVWVQPLGPAHTDGDVVVWIDGILVAGDVIEEGTLWLEGADIESWAATLEALAARGPALVIPAHGGLPESTNRAALLHLHRDALMRVSDYARNLRPGAEISTTLFADLRERYAEIGVGADAFDTWIAAAIQAARTSGGTR